MKEGRILVVDDDNAVLDSLYELLRDRFEVVKASSGEEGLTALSREEVHMVVTDYMMPGMDGLAFLEEIKKRYPDTGRMLMTAYADMDLVIRAMNQGEIHRFVSKPFKPFEFLRMVEECCRIGQSAQAAKSVTAESPSKQRRTVIVAHDSQIFLTRMKIVLSQEFNVLTTSNGLEVMGMVTTNPVDALVLGICLENMDGPTIAEYLKKEKGAPYPIILISGDATCPESYLSSIGAKHWIDCSGPSADQEIRKYLNTKVS